MKQPKKSEPSSPRTVRFFVGTGFCLLGQALLVGGLPVLLTHLLDVGLAVSRNRILTGVGLCVPVSLLPVNLLSLRLRLGTPIGLRLGAVVLRLSVVLSLGLDLGNRSLQLLGGLLDLVELLDGVLLAGCEVGCGLALLELKGILCFLLLQLLGNLSDLLKCLLCLVSGIFNSMRHDENPPCA